MKEVPPVLTLGSAVGDGDVRCERYLTVTGHLQVPPRRYTVAGGGDSGERG